LSIDAALANKTTAKQSHRTSTPHPTSRAGSPDVGYFQTTSLRVVSEGAVPVEVDGELIGNCPVEFAAREPGLRVLAPPPKLAREDLS
jgi:diacylglycerol kinase family enzyme